MSDIALTVSVLALVAVVGLWIGNVKIRGVGFGIGGVLFGGIIVGHFVDQAGIALSSPMLHFIQEFGLILFVYTIGIQVGPGFFASLRVSGLRLNLFAILIVILGGLVTAVLHKLFDIPLPVVLGIFSGAVTNTPALGAGQQILRDLGVPFDVVDQMGMSYAMAYPFGICGILLTSPQGGRIGDCTGENTQHHRKRDSEDFMQQRRDQTAKNNNQNGKQI